MFRKFLGRKKNAPPEGETLKQRTDRFWNWFSEHAETFYQAIEDQNFDNYSQSFITKIDEIFPGIAWVFGPGPDVKGHSLTVSPEGDPYESIAIAYIVAQAPSLPGWTFYSSRQPSPTFAEGSMNIAGQKVSANEIWVTPDIDEDAEEIDLVCWTPVFQDLPEGSRGQITFLWLDEALGELNVTQRLGSIDIHGDKLAESFPLTELPEYVSKIEKEHQWKSVILGEAYCTYTVEKRADFKPQFLRSDIFTGTSLLHRLSEEHLAEDGNPPSKLSKWGVDFIFVALPRNIFSKGSEIDERGEIEDTLQQAFDFDKSGRVLGGASGDENLYLDIAIYDGKKAIDLVIDNLKADPIGKEGKVYFFDKGRNSQPLN
jgi:hypothetical protein